MANYNAPVKGGQSITIGCNNAVNTLTIQKDGLYKFDVYGGAGGGVSGPGSGASGGQGGHSVGYKYLEKGTILYVVPGGAGGHSNFASAAGSSDIGVAGYNGGCKGEADGDECGGSSGGCTHIATVAGTLVQIGESNIDKILLVAGGGGGGYAGYDYGQAGGHGGNGGGLTGGYGVYNYNGSKNAGVGTQHDSGIAGVAYWGQGWNYGEGPNAAGGGGLYGGLSGRWWTSSTGWVGEIYAGGGGGSGYIGGVPAITYKGIKYNPSTVQGGCVGDGYAIITLIKRDAPLIYWGDKEVDALFYGDQEVENAYYGDQEIN